jgi:dihydropteroate synthase
MQPNRNSLTYKLFFNVTKTSVTTTAAISNGAVEMANDAVSAIGEGFDAAMFELDNPKPAAKLIVMPNAPVQDLSTL